MKRIPTVGDTVICVAGWLCGEKATIESVAMEDWGQGSAPYGTLCLLKNGDKLVGENLSEWRLLLRK